MRKNFFLSRILALFISALMLWVIFTSAIYNAFTRPTMVNMKRNELLPQAEWAAGQINGFSSGTFSSNSYANLVDISYKFFHVWTFIIFNPTVSDDASVFMTPPPEELKEEMQAEALKLNAQIADGGEPSCVQHLSGARGDFLFVAAPFFANQTDLQMGNLRGSVVMVQSLAELDLGLRGLTRSLFLASLLVGLILIIPIIFFASRLVRPLNAIRSVATAITAGDFSHRAYEDGQDEISDLGRSINRMSSRISSSINQLTLEKNRLEQIINSIAEGIIAVDGDGEITRSNAMIWTIFGRNPKAVTAADLLAIYGIDQLFKKCLSEGESIKEELTLDSDKKKISCQITPIVDAEGRISAAVGLFRDITEADRLEQTRRDYIANVSHELRTPITAMRALLEPLSDGMVKSEEDRQRYYNILLRETMRLSRLINDLLELSRLQSGRSFIHQEPLDSEDLFSEMSQRFAMMADDHGTSFTAEKSTALPMAWGNRDRIEQILIIYFDNALKFTPQDGEITFMARTEPGELIFSVKDTGTGIAPHDLHFVFERFYKADKAHNESGTGLGLSIAKTLADILSMKVSVSSELGKGSTFSLSLHLAADVMRKQSYLKDVYDEDDTDNEGDGSGDESEIHSLRHDVPQAAGTILNKSTEKKAAAAEKLDQQKNKKRKGFNFRKKAPTSLHSADGQKERKAEAIPSKEKMEKRNQLNFRRKDKDDERVQ